MRVLPRAAILIRPFGPADYERYVAITDAVYQGYEWSVTEAQHEDDAWDRQYFRERVVAGIDGQVVGVAQIGHMPLQFHADRYAIDILTDPGVRGHGVGGALYEHVLRIARGRGAEALRATVLEAQTDALRFLRQRGFADVQRAWESRLQLADFPTDRFASAETQLIGRGITISSFAQLRIHDAEAERQLHELYASTVRDAPHVDPITPPSLAHFSAEEIHAPTALLDGWFVAQAGERYVGMSTLMDSPNERGVVYQNFVGVLAEYRGIGIATAMKTRTAHYVLQLGRTEIRTWNNERNLPSQAINREMGFKRQAAYVTLELRLRAASGDPTPGTASR